MRIDTIVWHGKKWLLNGIPELSLENRRKPQMFQPGDYYPVAATQSSGEMEKSANFLLAATRR